MQAFRKLLKFMVPHWRTALLAPFFMVLEVLFDLAQPWLMQKTIDIGIGNGDSRYVLQATVMMIGVAVLGFISGTGGIITSTRAALLFAADLRTALFEKILGFSSQTLDRFETGPLTTRLTDDIQQTQGLVMSGLRLLIRAPLTMAGALFMAILTAPPLSPVMVVMLPLLSIVLVLIIRNAFPRFRKVQDRLDQVNAVIQETITGIRVIKSFVREAHETQRFERHNAEMTQVNIEAGRMVSLIFPLMFLLINLGVVAVLWYGGRYVIADQMQVGQVVAFINYLLLLLYSLMMMGMVLMNVSRAEASAVRIMELFDEPSSASSGSPEGFIPSEPWAVAFDNVSFCFASEACDPVLKNITFQIKPGETVAVMGMIGSGKTTLLHLIPRLLEPSAGSIVINGMDHRRIESTQLRARIGLVHQAPLLFTGSIADNILFGHPEASEMDIRDALRAAQALDFVEALPESLDHAVTQKGKNLSGGQKQRLAIARALVRKPALLLLDDCTSALDSRTEADLLRALAAQENKPTTLMVVQRISTARKADRILLLEDGILAGIGTHHELLAHNPLYIEIFNSQRGNGEVVA